MTQPPEATAAPDLPSGPREVMFRCVVRGDPLHSLLRAAEKTVGRPIWVEFVDGVGATPPVGRVGAAAAEGGPPTSRRFAITAARRRLGTLFVDEAAGPTSQAERALAREAAVALALYALLRQATETAAQPSTPETGRDTWLQERFDAWCAERDLDEGQRIVVLSLKVPDAPGADDVLEAVRHGLERSLASRHLDAFVSWREREATVAVAADDERADRVARAIAANLTDQLRLAAPGAVFYVGVAPGGPAVRFALRAEQARLAAEVGAVHKRQPLTHLTELKSYGAMRMAVMGADSRAAFGELHARYLGPLLANEARTRLPLLRTLISYLDENCNVSATARMLDLTRQSMYYRLRRIEELCDVDLTDPFDRFAVELAFRSWVSGSVTGSRTSSGGVRDEAEQPRGRLPRPEDYATD